MLLFQYAAKIVEKADNAKQKVLKRLKKTYLFCFVFNLHYFCRKMR